MFASGCSFSLKYCLIRSPYPLPRIVDSLTSRLTSVLLRLFPLAFWNLIILEWWAKREKVLSKTQNYYIDTNAVKLIAAFCSALLVWASSNKWTGKVVARSNWRQKKARQRRTRAFLFNLSLWAIFHLLHPQVMPHAILQTRPVCYPHRCIRQLCPALSLSVLG